MRGTEVPSSPSSKINLNFGFSKQIRPRTDWMQKMPSNDKTSEKSGQIALHLCQITQLDPLVWLVGVLDASGPHKRLFTPSSGTTCRHRSQTEPHAPREHPSVAAIRRCRSACSGIGGERASLVIHRFPPRSVAKWARTRDSTSSGSTPGNNRTPTPRRAASGTTLIALPLNEPPR